MLLDFLTILSALAPHTSMRVQKSVIFVVSSLIKIAKIRAIRHRAPRGGRPPPAIPILHINLVTGINIDLRQVWRSRNAINQLNNYKLMN
jgi:hypothetical protein